MCWCNTYRLNKYRFLSAGGHKWLMSVEGSGILYAAEHTHQFLSPNTSGWLSHENGLQFLLKELDIFDTIDPSSQTYNLLKQVCIMPLGL